MAELVLGPGQNFDGGYGFESLKDLGGALVDEAATAARGLAYAIKEHFGSSDMGIAFAEAEDKDEEESEEPEEPEEPEQQNGTVFVADEKVVADTDDDGIQTIVEVHKEHWKHNEDGQK